jgi:hypothetical protein
MKIYRRITLPLVLCESGTWSLSLMEVHRLRVLENRILRKIDECEREDVTNIAVYTVFLF